MHQEDKTTTDIICLSNWHATGGAQLNAGMLTAEFARRGYRAELGFLFERDIRSQHGTESFFVIAPRPPRSPSEWRGFFSGLKREIIDRRPKAIFGFQPTANILGAIVSTRIAGCRMIGTQRNPSDRQSAWPARLELLCGSTGLYTANIAVTETVAASFNSYPESYRRKLRSIHNATPPLEDVNETLEVCRARLGVPECKIVLGCLGRLHPQKNVTFALQVLAQIPEACLYLAGDGPERRELESQAKALGVSDRTFFIGALTGADITRFYRSIDILLFPSLYEGFGRVLTEAMSQGVAIVANDLPVVREVGETAVLTRPLRVNDWAETVRELKGNHALKERLALQGRERAAAFTLRTMADGYLLAAELPLQTGMQPQG